MEDHFLIFRPYFPRAIVARRGVWIGINFYFVRINFPANQLRLSVHTAATIQDAALDCQRGKSHQRGPLFITTTCRH